MALTKQFNPKIHCSDKNLVSLEAVRIMTSSMLIMAIMHDKVTILQIKKYLDITETTGSLTSSFYSRMKGSHRQPKLLSRVLLRICRNRENSHILD